MLISSCQRILLLTLIYYHVDMFNKCFADTLVSIGDVMYVDIWL